MQCRHLVFIVRKLSLLGFQFILIRNFKINSNPIMIHGGEHWIITFWYFIQIICLFKFLVPGILKAHVGKEWIFLYIGVKIEVFQSSAVYAKQHPINMKIRFYENPRRSEDYNHKNIFRKPAFCVTSSCLRHLRRRFSPLNFHFIISTSFIQWQ